MRSLLNINDVEHRLKRLRCQAQPYEKEQNPSTTFSYWGGENYGRILGQIMVLEELLDELEIENE